MDGNSLWTKENVTLALLVVQTMLLWAINSKIGKAKGMALGTGLFLGVEDLKGLLREAFKGVKPPDLPGGSAQ